MLAFFRVNPAKSFNQPDFFIRSACFDPSSGQPRQGGGGEKKSKNRRVFFSRYLAANAEHKLPMFQTRSSRVHIPRFSADDPAWEIDLYKIFVYFGAVVHKSTILSPPRPPALPTLVQHYCTMIGQYTTPLPIFRLYVIHHTILVRTISCKGQVGKGSYPHPNRPLQGS